jgi:multidrug efflux pump subunit AcrA (membrane-fusion protein)
MHLEPAPGPASAAGPPREAVSTDPAVLQSLGYRSEEVRRRPLRVTLRLPARIIPDASRVRPVISRVDGFVTGLDVWSSGQRVRKGQPLLQIYSLGILSLQQQYLNSSPAYGGKRFQPPPNRTPAAPVDGATEGVDRSRLRLKDWDFSDKQIARIERTGVAEETLEMASPASGFITAYNVVPGQRVAPGDLLLTLTDLDRVWAEVDVYERDAPLLREGIPVTMEVSALPGRTFPGRVRTFQRALDPETRTSRVLVDLENREGLLLPGMLATASLEWEGPEALVVPAAAVLRTGGKEYAFRETAPGKLEPVPLSLGRRGDGCVEVLRGLREGDRVAASALFFVDSESSLRAAFRQAEGKR